MLSTLKFSLSNIFMCLAGKTEEEAVSQVYAASKGCAQIFAFVPQCFAIALCCVTALTSVSRTECVIQSRRLSVNSGPLVYAESAHLY